MMCPGISVRSKAMSRAKKFALPTACRRGRPGVARSGRLSSSLHTLAWGSGVLSVGLLFAACSDSGDPPPATGGTGATGSGGTGGAGGTTGGAGGATGGAGGSAGSVAGTGGGAGTGGAATGGGAGTTGGAGTGGGSGAGTGGTVAGASGTGGAGAAGAPAGGSAGDAMGGAGAGGSAGSAGSGGTAGSGGGVWACPSGVTGTPTLTGAPTRVAGVPPPDSFNMNNGNFGNIEGPVWIDDALYVSEMSYMSYDSQNSNVKMSRLLKITSGGTVSIEIADSGSNGHAVDPDGNILAAVHKDGSITRYTLPGGTPATPVVSMFMNARFDSPNDLTLHTNGTIYFTDPNFQAPNTLPQSATRVYRVAPGSNMAEPIPNAQSPDQFGNPNGITLSLNQDFLYVAASTGRRYPVMGDGTLGAGENFDAASGGDGMVIDCAGNLYVARQGNVAVYEPDGTSIGNIPVSDVQSVTNVAFGGADHQTLYITGLGNNKGLFQKTMNIPGRPY